MQIHVKTERIRSINLLNKGKRVQHSLNYIYLLLFCILSLRKLYNNADVEGVILEGVHFEIQTMHFIHITFQ